MPKNNEVKRPVTREAYSSLDAAFGYFVVIPVATGVAYLNAFYPGWHNRVDLSQFNMRYTNADILAHIHGTDARSTYEYKEWSFRTLIAHGFYCEENGFRDYDSLTLRWRTTIESLIARNPK